MSKFTVPAHITDPAAIVKRAAALGTAERRSAAQKTQRRIDAAILLRDAQVAGLAPAEDGTKGSTWPTFAAYAEAISVSGGEVTNLRKIARVILDLGGDPNDAGYSVLSSVVGTKPVTEALAREGVALEDVYAAAQSVVDARKGKTKTPEKDSKPASPRDVVDAAISAIGEVRDMLEGVKVTPSQAERIIAALATVAEVLPGGAAERKAS